MSLQCGRPGFEPWVRKIPWRRKWQSTPVLLPGQSHGQRSPVGYSLWGRKELDTTEWLHFLLSPFFLYETTHYGCEALWNLLQRLLVGKGMKMVVAQITKSCDTCLQNNPRKMPPLLHYLDPFNTKENGYIDFTQMPKSRGNKYLLVKVDTFTRRRQWQPTPVLLPGKSHGQRSLVGCSPWGR